MADCLWNCVILTRCSARALALPPKHGLATAWRSSSGGRYDRHRNCVGAVLHSGRGYLRAHIRQARALVMRLLVCGPRNLAASAMPTMCEALRRVLLAHFPFEPGFGMAHGAARG